MRKVIALLLILSTGLSLQNYTACIDSANLQQNFSILVNNNQTNISVATVCQYGCDTSINKCKIIDSGYLLSTIMVLIFFTTAMFWLSHFFRRKNEGDEYDATKAGLGLLFMIIGMLGLFGLFIYAGSIVTGYDSSFLVNGVSMMNALSNIWGLVIGVFVLMVFVFYIMTVVRDRMVDKRQ
jgi:hypothetical protein